MSTEQSTGRHYPSLHHSIWYGIQLSISPACRKWKLCYWKHCRTLDISFCCSVASLFSLRVFGAPEFSFLLFCFWKFPKKYRNNSPKHVFCIQNIIYWIGFCFALFFVQFSMVLCFYVSLRFFQDLNYSNNFWKIKNNRQESIKR